MHFQSGSRENGAEFAHKTVGEYFTAVKLYEDYFECVKDPETTTEQVWRNIFEAFRYSSVPEDILNFLVELTKNGLGDPPEKLFDHYYKGMEEQMLWRMMNEPVIEEYPLDWESLLLPERIGCTFHKLINYLTAIGFDNINGDAPIIRRVFESYFPNQHIDVHINFKNWNLKQIALSGVDLVGINFSGANLSDAYLGGACLFDSKFKGANLTGTNLGGADLAGAVLTHAIMTESDYEKLPIYIREKYTYNTHTGRLELREGKK
jgi:hypothetical protein